MKTRIRKETERKWEGRPYIMTYWEDYDYSNFSDIVIRKKSNKGETSYADLIIMADTETSRKHLLPKTDEERHNHVCAWSCAFRAFGRNLVTLWGRRPSDFPRMLKKLREYVASDELYIYFHNLPYDWHFLKKFILREMGKPAAQLNVKPLYPLSIRFENGIILKDSLMLAQRSLEKWGSDLGVEHAKAVGKWDYGKIRNYDDWYPDEDELLYMECDVLCGVECIDKTLQGSGKTIGSVPLTATGIVRVDCRNVGRKYHAHDWAVRLMPETYDMQKIFEDAFHGGYAHGNRHILGVTFPGKYNDQAMGYLTSCFDISSSYPFALIAYKYPSERFWKVKREKPSADYILNNSEEYAFLIKLRMWGLSLKDKRNPMPVLSLSKCLMDVNSVTDNGRILESDYAEIWLTEIDFALIWSQYQFTGSEEHPEGYEIEELYCSRKDYLPKWFTDYVYNRYKGKTLLKGGDKVLYNIEKSKVNALFGMSAQKPVKEDIVELYEDKIIDGELYKAGEFVPDENFDHEKAYAKYRKNRNTFLPYFIGVWCTSYAQRNLFELGYCVKEGELWLYSDTDSVYSTGFDLEKLDAYNKKRKAILKERGYGAVLHEGREYWLGIAELDGRYMQFRTLHSKCYCVRPWKADGEDFVMGDSLKITVAGVPKRGAKCLKNRIENFQPGFIFDGEASGKLQHTHFIVDDIYVDDHGNETGDSIELGKCDYMLSGIDDYNHNALEDDELLESEEIAIITYEEGDDET